MSDVCRAFERLQDRARSTDREGHTQWAAHVRVCASCQEQDVADRTLRAALSGVRQPELPAHRCASRIRSAPAAEPLNRRARAVLRAYWLLTLVVGIAVLARADWPTAIPAAVAVASAVVTLVVLVPVLLLARIGGGLLALLRRTIA